MTVTTEERIDDLVIRTTLSALWVFELLTMLVQDVHELFRDGQLEGMLAGEVDGTRVTDVTLLVAGLVLALPLLMVVLSLVLPRGVARWVHTFAVVVLMAGVAAVGVHDLDDYVYVTLKATGFAAVVWYLWRPVPVRPVRSGDRS